MSRAFQRGLRTLSWTRVVPRAHRQTRGVQIRAAPTGEPTVNGDHLPLASVPNSAESRGMKMQEEQARSDRWLTRTDARFEVVGAPYSLLSVSLSASQNLYTRRGTLVGLSGKADNVCSHMQSIASITHEPRDLW